MLSNEAVQHLQKLARITDQLARGELMQRQTVEAAFRERASWSSIGAAMGISRQAARQRFAPRRDTPTSERLF